MPLFSKRILSPGTYHVTDKRDGRRKPVFISPERLKSWVQAFQRMRSNGLKIPAPWRHDPAAQPLRLAADEQDTDAFQNAGFWEKLWVGPDAALYGQLSVPRDEDASKVGETVTDVSPLIVPKWNSTGPDGQDIQYDECLTHIALVTHPVAPGQENFQPRPTLGVALSMQDDLISRSITQPSQLTDDFAAIAFGLGVKSTGTPVEPGSSDPTKIQARGASISKALPILRELGLSLPADTDETNFAERIIVAALAIKGAEEQDDDLEDQPQNSKEQPSPVAMAELSPQDKALVAFAQNFAKKSYEDRIKAAIESGRVTPDYAAKQLTPLLAGLTLQFSAEGQLVPGNLDAVLSAVEAIPPGAFLTGQAKDQSSRKRRSDLFPGHEPVAFSYVEETNPEDLGEEFDPDEIVKTQLASAGIR